MTTSSHRSVAVAMSGGVDSTAVMLLLRERGVEVFGVTALLSDAAGSALTAERAQAVCRRLSAPHHTVDLRDAFYRQVIEPFINDYAAGRTPNPCVRCNEHIKFGLLLEATRTLGADGVATGHYAGVDASPADGPYLLRGADLNKDQSYVLHHVPADALARSVWVHSGRYRADNERLVAESGLDIAPLPASQDVCFLPSEHLSQWLAIQLPDAFRPGPIVSVAGEVLGAHRGLIGYTIGQRKGLGIGGPGGRKFVLHIDLPGNRLILGDDKDLWVSWCCAEKLNLIGEMPGRFDCQVMTRYNGTLTRARVTVQEGSAQIDFSAPARAPTPGQSAVFYQDRRCIGGGVITQTELTARFGG